MAPSTLRVSREEGGRVGLDPHHVFIRLYSWNVCYRQALFQGEMLQIKDVIAPP